MEKEFRELSKRMAKETEYYAACNEAFDEGYLSKEELAKHKLAIHPTTSDKELEARLYAARAFAHGSLSKKHFDEEMEKIEKIKMQRGASNEASNPKV
jgi:hypothetical protein